MSTTSEIRLVIQQPALPAYRVPVFRELALRPGIRLKLLYGEPVGGPPNVPPEGFGATLVREQRLPLGRRTLLWHSAQWRPARRDVCDVLMLSWNLHYASLWPALRRARRQGVGTILWGHGYSKQEAGWRAGLRNRVGRQASALLLYNHATALRLVNSGFASQRVFVALNALDQSPIATERQWWLDRPAELAAFRTSQKLDNGPLLLFVSRFDPANRLDLLVEAAAILSPQFPGLTVALIGKGEEEAARLRRLAAQRGVEPAIRLVGPIYDQHQLAPWFLSARALVYPANIGLTLLHAMGYGLPVVTSDKLESQNPEIEALRDGANGLLYRHGDAAALARTIARLLADAALAKRLSAGALETVSRQFTLKNMVDGMEAAVRFAAAATPGS